MINVWISGDSEFEKFKPECKSLYETSQDKICDDNSFEFVIHNTLFYLFETEGYLIGAIYYFLDEGGRLFLNGFAKRKIHNLCLECLKMSLNWFRGSIYAEAQNRASALCLLRCGFKREQGNVFKYEKL